MDLSHRSRFLPRPARIEPRIGAASGPADAGLLHKSKTHHDELLLLLRSLLLRWKVIVLITVIVTASAGWLIRSIPPTYVATAHILIDHAQTKYADLTEGAETRQTTVWPTELESYMKVLWSDQLAEDVVRTVGVEAFPAEQALFAPMRAWLRERAAPLVDPLMELLAQVIPAPTPALTPLLAEDLPEHQHPAGPPVAVQKAIRVLHDQLEITREPLAAVISVEYSATDPDLVARIANATADAFPKELMRAQKAALAASANYLGARVAALANELEAADAQAQVLRQKLTDFGGGSIAERRYGELLKTLAEAEAELTDSKSDVALAAAVQAQPLDDRFGSALLADLRQQDQRLSRHLAEIGTDLQERHPLLATARAEQAEVRSRIRAEEARIRTQMTSEMKARATKVAWIKDQLAKVEHRIALDMTDRLELKQLTTRTDSTRLLYQDILTRYQRAREQQLMVQSPARVINVATRPNYPQSRKKWLALAAIAFGSLAASSGLVVLTELRRRGYRSAEELRADTDLPVIGVLPAVNGRIWKGGGTAGETGMQRRIYAEAIRRASLRLLPADRPYIARAELLLITSAVPGDGKTVVTLSIGRQLASSGLKVLIVDADLRKRSLKDHLKHLVLPRADLASLLTLPETKIDDALVRDPRSQLDFLLAQEAAEDPARLFGSAGMSALLADLSSRYDVILIDSPPILPVSDTVALVPLVDRILFVARWQATPRKAVNVSLDEIQLHGGRVCELILNKVNLRTYPRYAGSDQLAHFRLSAGYLR